MEPQCSTALAAQMADAFACPSLEGRLHRADNILPWRGADWPALLRPLTPLRARLTCSGVLSVLSPLLTAPPPPEGWLSCAYKTALSLLYPDWTADCTHDQRDGALCFLQALQLLLDEERRCLPFDPWLDFAFCTGEELSHSGAAEEVRRFQDCFRTEFLYELLRLSREVTPFRTLEHIAGVHHTAMTVARAFHAAGGPMDLGLLSCAAAGHDLGKFGCRPGERVPYLHYYYTDRWFTRRGLPTLGRIAANHSVWDLELENLSAESLALVYADFRVKQTRDEQGRETPVLFSLEDAFAVILSKLDQVDAAKERRYRYVYEKLRDFEGYLRAFGVDVTLSGGSVPPPPRPSAALLTEDGVESALTHAAVDHNLRLMDRLDRQPLFSATLEAARGEKAPGRIRAYLSIFGEYFPYWSAPQKEQTLAYLYELLLEPDGDVRRQAAGLLGRILASFRSGYRKELPCGTPPSPDEKRPFALWSAYLDKCIHPDRRLTARQASMIRYQAKTAVDALLEHCAPADLPRFAGELLRQYASPEQTDPAAAFALLDTVLNIPLDRMPPAARETLCAFAVYWLDRGGLPQRAAALRLLRTLAAGLPETDALHGCMVRSARKADCAGSTPLLYLQSALCRQLGEADEALEARLDRPEAVGAVFLDNLKTATPWVLKAAGVEYLRHQSARGDPSAVLHIATHFSNLIKVSEHVVVRRMAGAALLDMAPLLTAEQRNEIAVELSKSLETGQAELSQYIPEYLGQFALWLTPRELDEVLEQMRLLLTTAPGSAAAAALSTVGAMLEHFADYAPRFGEGPSALTHRRRQMAGLLLKGLASRRESVRQEALRIFGERVFASGVLSYEDKTALFALTGKKLLFLLEELPERELTFFYTAAMLSHLYRFLVTHRIETGPFPAKAPQKAAFFPGTFDPFSLSHLGIVHAIRNLGFEVYLAIDEFSWSKKTQPSLIRRQIASISVADEFDVYLFPHDLPVNLATPEDLNRLRAVFAGRPLYVAVGSDVLTNASCYRAAPAEGSIHSLNHIVFHRAGQAEPGNGAPLTGQVISLQLPPHLEDISSTRIRENIDLGRDVSNLIDPAAQELIYANSLYLREPQYKPLIRAGTLEFSLAETPGESLRQTLANIAGCPPPPDCPEAQALLLRERTPAPHVLGAVFMRTPEDRALYGILGSEDLADRVRMRAGGPIRLLTGLYAAPCPGESRDAGQLLITEALSRAVNASCTCAVWYGPASPATLELLARQGFVPLADGDTPLLAVDLRSPAVVLQNVHTALKEPFASHPQVLRAAAEAHRRLQQAVCGLYPGSLVLSLNAEIIHHRLVEQITARNGVPLRPAQPRVLGDAMCVPFGKLLRGSAVPNTVTKTIHTDKVFAPDLRSFDIRAFPGYPPLESQIRTIRSFRRPVILVDDLLHSGNRINALDPLFRQEGVDIDRVLVGLLSGRGRDLMAAKGRTVDCAYFVPNLRSWFVETTLYPFIGGDAVGGAAPSVPGLTPAVNLILPYAFPRFYKDCDRGAVLAFSRTCLENARLLLLALEESYRQRYTRSLTLPRLSEAVVLPLSPDKGDCLRYDSGLTASACLDNDLRLLLRMRDVMESSAKAGPPL